MYSGVCPRSDLWTRKHNLYRVVHGSAPTYLTELCQPCSDTRLRSTSCGDFIVPRFNRQLSNSSFSVAAPSAWNRLPSHIRTSSTYTLFLTRLKTRLFADHYCDTVMLLYFHCISGAPELWMWGAIASSCWLIDWLILSATGKRCNSCTAGVTWSCGLRSRTVHATACRTCLNGASMEAERQTSLALTGNTLTISDTMPWEQCNKVKHSHNFFISVTVCIEAVTCSILTI